jgi:hypothetical protein
MLARFMRNAKASSHRFLAEAPLAVHQAGSPPESAK